MSSLSLQEMSLFKLPSILECKKRCVEFCKKCVAELKTKCKVLIVFVPLFKSGLQKLMGLCFCVCNHFQCVSNQLKL